MDEETLIGLVAAMPWAVTAGVRLDAAAPEEVRGRLAWRPDLCTVGDVVHGGALMTLTDSVGAVCAVLNLPPGAGTSTLQSSTNLLRAVRNGEVTATARPLHVGRSTIVVRTEVADEGGRPVAHTVQTQAILR